MHWSASLVKLVRPKVESSSGMTSGVDLWSPHTHLCTCIHTWLLTHAQSPSLSPSISLSRHKDSPLQSGRKKITYSKPGHVRHCLTLFFFLNKQTNNKPHFFPLCQQQSSRCSQAWTEFTFGVLTSLFLNKQTSRVGFFTEWIRNMKAWWFSSGVFSSWVQWITLKKSFNVIDHHYFPSRLFIDLLCSCGRTLLWCRMQNSGCWLLDSYYRLAAKRTPANPHKGDDYQTGLSFSFIEGNEAWIGNPRKCVLDLGSCNKNPKYLKTHQHHY